MPELTVLARAKAKPGFEAALERELRAVVAPTHEEPGCLRYGLHRSVEDPAAFVMVERWASKEALDRHFTTPHVKTLLKNVAELVAAPPEITIYEPVPEGQPEKAAI